MPQDALEEGLVLALASFTKTDPQGKRNFVYKAEFPDDDILTRCAERVVNIWINARKLKDSDNNVQDDKVYNEDVKASMVEATFEKYKKYAFENWSGEKGKEELQFQFKSHIAAINATMPQKKSATPGSSKTRTTMFTMTKYTIRM